MRLRHERTLEKKQIPRPLSRARDDNDKQRFAELLEQRLD
jgi:hypothetical protein